MTANSATGSKFYELINSQQAYIAKRSQNWLPSYSVISMTGTSFSIVTYQITDTGATEAIDQPFTIQKTGAAVSASAVLTRGEALTRIYNAAGAPPCPPPRPSPMCPPAPRRPKPSPGARPWA